VESWDSRRLKPSATGISPTAEAVGDAETCYRQNVPPRVVERIIDLVGETPLLRLAPLEPAGGATIWAKLEYFNPGLSVKDRTALGMILAAEADGRLQSGATIIEPTAGNTGIGLALVGRQRGYRVVLVVPENFSREKRQVMAALGGEVVLTPAGEGIQGAIRRARDLAARTPGAFVPQQFENQANPRFHYQTTAAELLEQTRGRVDAIVLGAGTGGTFSGVVRRFREAGCVFRSVLVEPVGSIWGGGPAGSHKVEGIGNSFWPDTLDRSLADEIVSVGDDQAFQTVLALARECGVLAGGSGGAAVYAAIAVARRFDPDRTVLTLVPDSAERYLSTGILEQAGID
jgi:cysteine synthase A